MDIVRLRVLTLKSKVFFLNKNTEKTVGEIIKDDSYKIIKAYYMNHKISFNEEVLNILKEKYPLFYKIEKPGIDKCWNKKIFTAPNWEEKDYEELKKIIISKKINKQKIDDELMSIYNFKKYNHQKTKDNMNLSVSKKDLMGKNHGR